MPRKNTCGDFVKTKYNEEISIGNSCLKEEHLITPNDYANMLGVEEVPSNFKELVEIAIMTLNRYLITHRISVKSKNHPCWNSIKKAIIYQIKYIEQHKDWFGLEIAESEVGITDVKIGDFSYKQGVINKIDVSKKNRQMISSIAMGQIQHCGFSSRVIC